MFSKMRSGPGHLRVTGGADKPDRYEQELELG
jgi:hypothetical protein